MTSSGGSVQHRAVLASPPEELPPERRPRPGPIAVLPEPDEFFVTAIEQAGGTVAPLSGETRGVVWLSNSRAGEFAGILREHPGIDWVQLPWAGVDAFAAILRDHAGQDRPIWTSAKGAYAEPVAEHALALTLALPWAELRAGEGAPDLLLAIELAAHRFFLRDTTYPAHYEPSGADFLSPALTEAVLMRQTLDPQDFRPWFDAFLPDLPGEPRAVLTPASVSDPTDGQIAHLHGLNLSRAWGWLTLSEALPADDPRRPVMLGSAERHADASLPFVIGSHYMVEHWLAVYAVLMLTFDGQ